MNRKTPRPHRAPPPAALPADAAAAPVDDDAAPDDDTADAAPEIVERPDGWYWLTADRSHEFGPFDSRELAEADCEAVGDDALAPGVALQQAERDIGIADWLDDETGEPAEGASPPHLRDD